VAGGPYCPPQVPSKDKTMIGTGIITHYFTKIKNQKGKREKKMNWMDKRRIERRTSSKLALE
jgi:hypothetical protein